MFNVYIVTIAKYRLQTHEFIFVKVLGTRLIKACVKRIYIHCVKDEQPVLESLTAGFFKQHNTANTFTI